MRQLPLTEGVQIAAYGAYLTATAVMSYSLLQLDHLWREYFYFFPALLVVALFSSNYTLRHLLGFAALALFISGGFIQPIPLHYARDTLIFFPLCYVILFPASIWPVIVAAALINGYINQMDVNEFTSFVDTSVRMSAVTIFATLLTYSHARFVRKADLYKTESMTDYLTKLPNLYAYKYKLSQLNQDNFGTYGVVHVGLIGFKNVNDRLGYRHGDHLLAAFAKYMRELVADRGELYRLGGDEFIVVLQSTKNIVSAVDDLVKLLAQKPRVMFEVDNTSHKLSYAVGVALAADASNNPELLSKNSDFALYKARSEGPGSVCWFDDTLLNETIRQHQIETEIKEALESGQFALMYQPKAMVQTGLIAGAESLIRWNHPQLGPISPGEFIPVAEKTAQIVPLGRWIIYEACRQAKLFSEQGLDVPIAVNVSTVQFEHSDLFEVVRKALYETSLPSHLLQLEITESALMNDFDNTIDICRQLRAIGVTIAIDDFGVEYSSMKYLKQLPIDVIKIDKCFVDEVAVSASDRILVRTMIQMGHSLGLYVVAEGIEDQKQLDVLLEEGCDQYQGYLYSQPVPCEEFISMLKREEAV